MAKHAPENSGNVEHKCLERKEEWHPLIVVDLSPLTVLISIRYKIAERYPVGILHPAVVLRVLLHSLRELRWNPAVTYALLSLSAQRIHQHSIG